MYCDFFVSVGYTYIYLLMYLQITSTERLFILMAQIIVSYVRNV